MPPLPSTLRKDLEKAVVRARDSAEASARAALTTLAVERDAPFASMDADARRLRVALRAKAAQLGGAAIKDGGIAKGKRLLVEEIAYQQWHQMLFARFLAENDLLMHPQIQVAVSLEECAELAPEEGAADAWELAARYASAMLPGLFPREEPAVQARFAPEGRHALERILNDLPAAVFTSDDGLGWVYQFWQSKRKDEVNASEAKIGAGTIGPVTQLFTEDYMVKFLLHNSLGAWWAARHPDSPLVAEFEYLRWRERDKITGWQDEEATGWQDDKVTSAAPIDHSPSTIHHSPLKTPAAGAFPAWPDTAAEITMMDPSGGSGHFMVAGFEMLYKMRMEEEGLSPAQAGEAVIRDNLFMLEIDPRCTQIATFNLLLAAWKTGGYRDLPLPHIACSGIAVEGQLDDWLALAGDDQRLRRSLERLYNLFRNAPTLGSLIDPTDTPLNERMFSADYAEVAPLLEQALARERQGDDPGAALLGAAAKGAARAARLLAGKYTLVATNVPYLARGKQGEILRDFCQGQAPEAKNDLATVFLDRCLDFCAEGGTTSIVLPQNWLFLTSYKKFRQKLLQEETWHLVARLGEGGFESSAAAGAFTILITLSRGAAPAGHAMAGLDVSAPRTAAEKAAQLRTAEIKVVEQRKQLENPDARVVLEDTKNVSLLKKYAYSYKGITTGDDPKYRRNFWELDRIPETFKPFQSTLKLVKMFGGCESIVWYDAMTNPLQPGVYIRAKEALGKSGVMVSQMRNLPVALYLGVRFDTNAGAIIPYNPAHLPAIWAFCSSPEYNEAVRQIDQSLKVTNSTLVKVPFDHEHWQSVAEERYPDGLPEPWSNDPTQWLFSGHPAGSTDPLQVAVARLLGYRWPAPPQAGAGRQDDDLDQFADADGIVCLPPVAGEQPASERLRALLAHAYSHPPALPDFERYRVGDFVPTTPADPYGGWSPGVQDALLAHAGFEGKSLARWLRDGFFKQHVKLFKNRPFIWHVWDGKKEGFHALVNYHKLDAAALDKLIYTYLGAWISRQRAARDAGEPGADGLLVAALELKRKLELIREGEPPYDIYVRWKPLHEQPLGWTPDLNDGVRLNIRPWVTAGVLRHKFSIHWKKDRGKNPDGSERWNDRHFTRAEKVAARAKVS